MNELVSIFIFWVIIVAPGATGFRANVEGYPTMEGCEATRELTETMNHDLPGFAIAPECIEIPVTPSGEGLPIKRGFAHTPPNHD